MAAALIPQQRDTADPFWVTAARQLFANGAGVLLKRGVTENRILVDHLLKTDLTALAEAMEGTVAQSIVDPENPKTALSVRAMLTAHLGALEVLPDTGKPFSIRDWISARDGGGFLFLTSRGDQHASLRGLISTWLEIAVNALLSLDQDDERRIWVILDELPTLHQVPSLQPGLAESRQFGGCFVLGIQVISALRDLYGRNGAETISGLCGTRVVLAAPDKDTAQWSAESLGRGEIEEVSEAYSYGANTIPRRRVDDAPARAPGAGAAVRDHAAGQSPRLSQAPRTPARGRDRAEIREAVQVGGAVSRRAPKRRRWTGRRPLRRRKAYGMTMRRQPMPEASRMAPAPRRRPPKPGPAAQAIGRGRICRARPEAAGTGAVEAAKPERPASPADGSGACNPAEHGESAPQTRDAPAAGPSKGEPARWTESGFDMVASIGAVASPAQGVSYYEREGYYARDDPAHRDASAWTGKGAEALGLSGPVDPEIFKAVLEGKVPDGDGRQLGRIGKDGGIHHRPGRDVTLSAPKSVSLAALVGGDRRVTAAHAGRWNGRWPGSRRTWSRTRLKDPETGRMVRAGGQKAVVATFTHDTSRNLDPQLHTHAVIANMVQGRDGKWRTMANEKLYASKMLIGALYRSELAGELAKLGYGIEKTHADGRFEIAGVPRRVIEAYSTRRAQIEAAMAERGLGTPPKTSASPSARR